jgi:DNA-binding response OmpR family regulator
VIEDDPIIGEMVSLYLTEEQYTVQRAATAHEGFEALDTFRPDLILLDLILPDSEGPEICLEMRKKTDLPIIVTSMKTAVADRIQSISYGADDYLVKPFSMQELKVRIDALLRRIHHNYASYMPEHGSPSSDAMQSGNTFVVDSERRTILRDGEPVDTTFSEYEIMKLFIEHPGKVYTREELINAVRGVDSIVNDRAVDVHVTNLRRKIEDNPRQPKYIRTVWGVGYKFTP